MHFHRDVLAICDTFSRHVLRPTPDDVFTGTPPFAFTFGLGGVLLFPLHAGASTVLVEKATPAELAAIIDDFGVTTCFTAPTAYKAMLAAGRAAALAAAGGLGGRAPAGGDLAGVPRCDRRPDHRRHRRDRDAAHLHLGGGRRHPCPARPGGRCPATRHRARRRGAEAAPGEPGRLAVKGPTGCRYLDDPRQRDYVAGRLEHHRRHVQPRRGRLLLVPGAQRRHDHLLGLQHRRAGGRGGAAGASGGRRVRRDRRARRGARLAGQGVRRPHRRVTGSRREGARAAGLRQGADRAVQVPARHRVRG